MMPEGSLRANLAASSSTACPSAGSKSRALRPAIAPLQIPTESKKHSASRWSELVPPQTALTFVAMYDPSEGLIGFSGSSLLLLESTYEPPKAPDLPHDGQSDVVTIDHFGAATPALSTAAMTSDTALLDMQAMLGAYFRGGKGRVSCDITLGDHPTPRVSSTLEGLYSEHIEQPISADTLLEMVEDALAGDLPEDSVYSDDFMPCSMRSACSDSPDGSDSGYGSAGEDTVTCTPCPRLAADSFFMYDDYSYNQLNECSAFSVTTTSTSDYVDVRTPSTAAFCHLAAPPDDKGLLINERMNSFNVFTSLHVRPKPSLSLIRKASSPSSPCTPSSPGSQRSRRLWKSSSSSASPAKPASVLSRGTYNYDWDDGDCKLPSPSRQRLRHALSKRFLRLKRDVDHNRWVLVEIEQRVAQYDLHDDEL